MNIKTIESQPKKVLSIAGSDPSGGAGLQADLKVFSQMGVYGAGAVSALTRQTSQGVVDVFPLPPEWVKAQIQDVLEDIQPQGIKTGMLGDEQTAAEIAQLLKDWLKCNHNRPMLVIDPVLASGGGVSLYQAPSLNMYLEKLFPLAYIITPNAPEAARLTGIELVDLESVKQAARRLKETGVQWVLIKGGHLISESDAKVTDLLYDGHEFYVFSRSLIPKRSLHGTGCTMASCIAALLVKGCRAPSAVEKAAEWLHERIKKPLSVGKGRQVVCQLSEEK